jgi:hypothetical protein
MHRKADHRTALRSRPVCDDPLGVRRLQPLPGRHLSQDRPLGRTVYGRQWLLQWPLFTRGLRARRFVSVKHERLMIEEAWPFTEARGVQ